MRLILAAIASAILIAPAIADDDCTDMGKLGVMLGHCDCHIRYASMRWAMGSIAPDAIRRPYRQRIFFSLFSMPAISS